MVIDCYKCNARVDCEVLSENNVRVGSELPTTYSFVRCPVCKESMVALQTFDVMFDTEGNPFVEPVETLRVWPETQKKYSDAIPEEIIRSLIEAGKCYHLADAYSACAVMCGRALEGVCASYQTKSKNLVGGLKELLDRNVIDQRIYKWGNALRLERNLAAHNNKRFIVKEDARDLLEFAEAICEYVFTLDYKFNEFLKRKEKKDNPEDIL